MVWVLQMFLSHWLSVFSIFLFCSSAWFCFGVIWSSTSVLISAWQQSDQSQESSHEPQVAAVQLRESVYQSFPKVIWTYELFSKIFQQTTWRHVYTHTSVFVRKPHDATLHFLLEAAKPRTRPREARGLQRRIWLEDGRPLHWIWQLVF